MQIIARINGTLPDITTLGSEENSERAMEIKKQNIYSNTSCSIFLKNESNQKIFHILVDIGQGIIQSIEKGFSDIGFKSSVSTSTSSTSASYPSSLFPSSPLSSNSSASASSSSSEYLPDALLITHAHEDHIKELPILIEKVISNSKKLSAIAL